MAPWADYAGITGLYEPVKPLPPTAPPTQATEPKVRGHEHTRASITGTPTASASGTPSRAIGS